MRLKDQVPDKLICRNISIKGREVPTVDTKAGLNARLFRCML